MTAADPSSSGTPGAGAGADFGPDRIAGFIERLAGKPEKTQRMIALSELSRIHRRKHPDGSPYAPTTNRRLITEYRTAIREALGEDAPLLSTFRYSPARVAEYKQHQAEQRNIQHENQRPLNASKHVDAATFLLGYTLNRHWSVPAAIVGVIALTGRRPYEVACVGQFDPDPDNDQQILFAGQTKTRDTDRAVESYTIPVLARRDLVLDAVGRLRAALDPETPNKTYSQRWGKEVAEHAKRNFHDTEGQPIVPRELREAYASVAYDRYAPRTSTAVHYYNQILGHKELDLDTSLFYFAFYLTDPTK